MTSCIGFKCEEVPLAVRRAVAFLLDRSAVVEDRDRPAYHLTPPSIFPGGRQGYRAHYRG
jgi:peptide/nickel transport system substrate-binding protein